MLNQQIQNYTILSPLGQGGMATVYLAEHNLLGNKSAFKLLNKEFVNNDNIRKRFLSEARNMARMSHPGIIKVTDLIDEGDIVAFVMEYVEEETLKEYIERKGKLTDEEINSIFSQMVEAVGYVHKQNLVHRDIKPSNFMVDPEGKVKLMDFGIAKNTDANAAEYTQTGTGMQMGTPMYMSPEQVKSTKEVTFASDIYSLGVVLWQMVTGEKPYDTKTLSIPEIQVNIIKEKLPIVNHLWDFIIQKATEKEIENRYPTCLLILESLKTISNKETIEFKPIIKDDVTIVELPKNKIDNYPNVKIGKQVWMTKNLDVDCFRNGDLIKEVKSTEEWQKAGQNGQPAWCYFENKLINDKKYGKLYNWYAVNDPRGLAPKGWHVPNYEEITILINYLGGKNIAGVKLKSELGWKKHFLRNGNGTNESFFNGFPGGYRSDFGFYNSAGYNGYWWILKDYASYNAFFLSLSANDDFVYRDNRNMSNGFSVRCIKD